MAKWFELEWAGCGPEKKEGGGRVGVADSCLVFSCHCLIRTIVVGRDEHAGTLAQAGTPLSTPSGNHNEARKWFSQQRLEPAWKLSLLEASEEFAVRQCRKVLYPKATVYIWHEDQISLRCG